MFCAYNCIFKANSFIFPDFFPYFLHILWYLYIFIAFLAYKCISMFISVLQVPLQGPALGLSDSIPVPLHSNSFISLMISPLYCPNTLVSEGQVNLAPSRALVGLAPGGAQNTWSTKLRWPLPISFTILGDPSTLSLSRKQKVKQLYIYAKYAFTYRRNHENSIFSRTLQTSSSLTFASDCHSLDVEILGNRGKRRPTGNYVAPRVDKPLSVNWLGRENKVSAVIAVTNNSTNKSST